MQVHNFQVIKSKSPLYVIDAKTRLPFHPHLQKMYAITQTFFHLFCHPPPSPRTLQNGHKDCIDSCVSDYDSDSLELRKKAVFQQANITSGLSLEFNRKIKLKVMRYKVIASTSLMVLSVLLKDTFLLHVGIMWENIKAQNLTDFNKKMRFYAKFCPVQLS